MSRYHVDSKAQLTLVQVALDQEFGLRDPAGNPTPREQMVHKPGLGLVPASVALGVAHDCYDMPGAHWPMIEGDDGTAALAIDDVPAIDAKLGRTVRGVALPRVNQLVLEAALPARVRAEIERRRAAEASEDLLGIGRSR